MANFVRIVDSGIASVRRRIRQPVRNRWCASLAAFGTSPRCAIAERTTDARRLPMRARSNLGWLQAMLAEFDDMEQRL